jgi:hypothetical protein
LFLKAEPAELSSTGSVSLVALKLLASRTQGVATAISVIAPPVQVFD